MKLLWKTIIIVSFLSAIRPVYGEPVWNTEHYFPSFSEPETIYVFTVPNEMVDWWSKATPVDWRITDSPETMDALTLVGLQGLVNRQYSCIYLDWEEAEHFQDRDGFWLPIMEQYVDIVRMPQQGVDAVNYLVDNYGELFSGAVVYDPEIPDTINVATMIAGLENRVILSPQQLEDSDYPVFDSVIDLRQTAIDEGWEATLDGRVEVYEWVYENLWPSLEKRAIGIACTGPPNSGSIDEEGASLFPLHLATRDYIIALKLPALWLNPTDPEEYNLFSRFLSEAPSPIPVFGNVERFEIQITELISSFGDWNAALTNGNVPISSGSLTCLGGIRPSIQRYEPEIDVDNMFGTLGDAPVFMIFTSDGDALQYNIDRGFWPEFTWDQMQGSGLAFTINPALIDLAPIIWNYYIDSADETALTCGYSGTGYMYPRFMDELELTEYLRYTSTYLEESGLSTIWVDTRGGEYYQDMAALYTSILRDSGLLGTYVGATSLGYLGGGFSYQGEPIPTVSTTYSLPGDYSSYFVKRNGFNRKPGEVLITMGTYPWHSGLTIVDEDASIGKAASYPPYMGPRYAVWGPWAALEPGDYVAEYRLKTSSTSVGKVAELLVTHGWDLDNLITLDEAAVGGYEFDAVDTYQTFKLEFTLSETTPWVEMRMTVEGAAEITLDYIKLRKVQAADFPVFSTVLITPYEFGEIHDAIVDIREDGGFVLSPDEFFGSLNPAYMIEWASNLLGETYPAIIQASEEFEGGDYYQSLLTVRDALRQYPTTTYRGSFVDNDVEINATITANTYMTDIRYDEEHNQIHFNTHGAPTGSIWCFVEVDNGVWISSLIVDEEEGIENLGDASTIGYEFPQGPHQVVLSLMFDEPPVADFSYEPLTVLVGETVYFFDESFDWDDLEYQWSFGDGHSSSEDNPSHIYAEEGIYTVSMTVVDTANMEGSTSKQIQVVAPSDIQCTNLVIPEEIRQGQTVTVTIDCTNHGGISGSEELSLIQDDMVLETKTVTLEPGQSTTLSYTFSPQETGTMTLRIDGVTETIEVEAETGSEIPGLSLLSVLLGVLAGVFIGNKNEV